ncbi:unnamed protein product [Acanthoscelides obtectus]|uniref:Endonuclease/exonuclease/phosphatase domain-containing protein n=1 Tax=Acanthoscelides obtectus TaxID=200917 RepID=A0A9P0LRS3_ACAOB|nr:unnamed protein product [Acanthoscelides obtectus]CAK1649421.1 hypothetical protein AOBTE_LOCUS16227 [Acanthoscelides obtectus]
MDSLYTIQLVYKLAKGNCLFINEKSVNTVLSKKIDASLGQIKNEILAIKDELLKHAVKETNPPADPPHYSDVLRNRTQPAIVIRPKNTNQSVTQTKTDILKSVDPFEANIHLGKVCDIKEGGIVLGCKSKADNLKLLSIATEMLGDSYVIKEVAGIHPRVRIVGLTGEYSDEQIRSYLLKDNPDVFCGDVECKVLKTYAVKKNNRIFQSVLQIDRVSYVRVMKAGSDRKFSAVNLRKGGGVAVAVRSEYKSSAIDIYVYPPFNQVSPKIDILVIKVSVHYSKIYVINLYIPPQVTVIDYEILLEAIHSLALLHTGSIFIVGDFNITSYADYLENSISNSYINTLNVLARFFNVIQYNYIHNDSGNLLDLIWSNAICYVEHTDDALVCEDPHHPALIDTVSHFPSTKHNNCAIFSCKQV